MGTKFTFYLIICFGLLLDESNAQSFSADFVRYLNEDGITYKDYVRVESKRLSSWHYIEKGKNPDEVFSFISPPQYKLVPLLDEKYNQILFSKGSFSLIREDSLRHEVSVSDGIYTFQNDYEENSQGYYGCFAVPDGFHFINYVWVFPSNFEIKDFESNRAGQWKLIDNTLSFIGTEMNNILFKIEYGLKEPPPMFLENRDVFLKDSMIVTNKAITISVWDDSKIDNDVISIKLNDEWIVKYLEAKQERIKFKYVLRNPVNYIMLRADNIGQIPPNTTAIEIDDGENKRTVVLNSDLGISEAIRIDLDGG